MTLLLTVREELGLQRRAELVEGGVPFPEGQGARSRRAPAVRRRRRAGRLPAVGRRALARRLAALGLARVPRRRRRAVATRRYTLEVGEPAASAVPAASVSVSESETGVRISTGAVDFRRPHDSLRSARRAGGRRGHRPASHARRTAGPTRQRPPPTPSSRSSRRGRLSRACSPAARTETAAGGPSSGSRSRSRRLPGRRRSRLAYRIVNREPGRTAAVAGWELVLRLAVGAQRSDLRSLRRRSPYDRAVHDQAPRRGLRPRHLPGLGARFRVGLGGRERPGLSASAGSGRS